MSKSFLSSIGGFVDFPDEDDDAADIRPAMPKAHTDCDDCGVPMVLDRNCYICNKCGAVKDGADQLEHSAPTVASAVSLLSGNGKLQIFNASGSADKSRADAIEISLLCNQRDYAAKNGGRIAFPHQILSAVATRFAEIQRQHVAEGYGPFIHRGDVRRCFIAALLRDECGHQQYAVKTDTIAEFMQLNTAGFSDGDAILLDLVEKGLTTMYDSCPTVKYVEKYLEFLEIKERRYVNFVIDIVEISETIKLCMSSHIQSKIVGAISLLVSCIDRPDITSKRIERDTDNTKENTFKKFHTAVIENLSMFIDAFDAHEIEYPTLPPRKKATRVALIREAIRMTNKKAVTRKREPKYRDPFSSAFANYK